MRVQVILLLIFNFILACTQNTDNSSNSYQLMNKFGQLEGKNSNQESPYSTDVGAEHYEVKNSYESECMKNSSVNIHADIPQCIYDYRGHRLNRGCNFEEPLICMKGDLIMQRRADEIEVCCCNYSVCPQ
jgi:hypothetical protein